MAPNPARPPGAGDAWDRSGVSVPVRHSRLSGLHTFRQSTSAAPCAPISGRCAGYSGGIAFRPGHDNSITLTRGAPKPLSQVVELVLWLFLVGPEGQGDTDISSGTRDGQHMEVVAFRPVAPFSALTHSKVHSALSASNHARRRAAIPKLFH